MSKHNQSTVVENENSNDLFYYFLERFGYFRVWYASFIQFNSIVFRIVAGVIGVLPKEAVAIITALEYFLTCALEVPFGFLADRIGRARASIIGIFLIMCGLTSCFMAIVLREYPFYSNLFIVIDGLCIGLGRPILSGSAEAFYQAKMHSHSTKDHELHTSFTTSLKFGKYIPMVVTLLAFMAVYSFMKINKAHYLLVLGALFYMFNMWTIYQDQKRFGDEHVLVKPLSFLELLKRLTGSALGVEGLIISSLAWLLVAPGMSFLLVSIGREYKDLNPNTYWYAMISFMLGTQTLGNILSGYLLPKWIKSCDSLTYILRVLLPTLGVSSVVYLIYERLSFGGLLLALFVFGVVYFFCFRCLIAFMSNTILQCFSKDDYAKALSMANVVGFFWHGVYAVYVAKYLNGSPPVKTVFLHVILFSAAGIVVYVQFKKRMLGRLKTYFSEPG